MKNMLKDLLDTHEDIDIITVDKFLKRNKDSQVTKVIDWNGLANFLIKNTNYKKIDGVMTDNFNDVVTKQNIMELITSKIRNIDPTLKRKIADEIELNIKNNKSSNNKYIVRFMNGFYNIKDDSFFEYKAKDDVSINQIPWNYKKNAKSEFGLEILKRYEGENIGFITQVFEAIGLMMVQDKDFGFKKSIFFNGPADYGKSLLFNEIIRPTIGNHNIGLFSMADLSNQELASFVQKTAVYDDDMDKGQMTPSVVSKFKKITGSDRLKAKLLYKDEFEFINYATAWINCNGLPEISDRGSGGSILTRMHVIQATVNVKEKYYDPMIVDKIKEHRKEISEWLISESMKALRNAWQKGELTETDASKQEIMDDIESRDTVLRFLKSNVWDGSPVDSTTLYKKYLDTFEKPINNFDTSSKPNFGATQLKQKSFGMGLKDHMKEFNIYKKRTKNGIIYERELHSRKVVK